MGWNVVPFKIFTIKPESEFLINETILFCPFIVYPVYTPVQFDRATGEILTELCEVNIIDKTTECGALRDLLDVITAVRL